MNKTIGIVILIIIVVGGAVAYAAMNKDKTMMDGGMEKESMEQSQEAMDSGMEKDMKKGDMSSGVYEAYSADKLAMAHAGDTVLFFHASWCPSCRALNSDIEANSAAIPSDLRILKVDYDTETALKQKYGVTTQHTLVRVAADGTMIEKWSGVPTLSRLVEELN